MAMPLLTALFLSACGVSMPRPVVVDVEPGVVFNGVSTQLTVRGENFYPRMEIANNADYTDGYEVSLFGPLTSERPTYTPLSGVTLTSYTSLNATVGQELGLTPGRYDVQVTAPTGAFSVAENALEVTDFQAARIDVIADALSYEVESRAWVTLQLLDYEGERVLAPLDVVVIVEDIADPDAVFDVNFAANGLEGQQTGEPANRILGGLDSDGSRTVGFTLQTPRTVRVRAVPQNTRSGVAEGAVALEFEAGDDLTVDIELPNTSFETVAGESFTARLQLFDQFGNAVDDRTESVILLNDCGGFPAIVDVNGPTDVELTLRQATSVGSCIEDRIRSVATGIEGESLPITVLPGAATTFEITVAQPAGGVIAGDKLDLFVFPLDAYDNYTSWSDPVEITDNVGGLASSTCVLGQPIKCTVVLTGADEQVSLTASGDNGLSAPSGTSATFAVSPGMPSVLTIGVSATVIAGEAFDLEVGVADAFGNQMDAGVLDPQDFLFEDPNDEVMCTFVEVDTGGMSHFDCVLRTAQSTEVTVTVTDPGVVGSSGSITVLNGPLASAEVVPDGFSVVAGEALLATVKGVDAYGNVLANGNKDVELVDSSGGMQPVVASLNQNGEAEVALVFELAGVTSVSVVQGGVSVPAPSEPIVVASADPDGLKVTLDGPWAWVGTPAAVRVEVRDQYGNRAEFSGDVEVLASSGLASDLFIPVVGGLGTGLLTWDGSTVSETLEAAADGLVGSSASFPVVRSCGVSGPTTDLAFSGGLGNACFDEQTETAVMSVEMGGSSGGAAAVYAYAVAEGDILLDLTTNATIPITLGRTGKHVLTGLAIQGDGCAAVDEAVGWVGLDDGEPVGMLDLAIGDDTLTVGVEDTTLSLSGAVDCAGDPAAGGTVRVRTALGQLTGVAQTGVGLSVTLDGTGSADFGLDASATHTGGNVTVLAGVDSAAAGGAIAVSFVGDESPPLVLDQEPSGDTAGPIGEVRLVFSEPLLETAIEPDAFAVTGAVIETAVLETSETVVLTLDAPVQAEAGVYTITATTDLRDEAGNRLDGDYTGAIEDYVGSFGDLPSGADPVTSCDVDTVRIRPDGDPGDGQESDEVTVSMQSVSAPLWWSLTVRDPLGSRILARRIPAVLAEEEWVWDGRDMQGKVVDNGLYTMEVDALDGLGNRGGECVISVQVDNTLVEEAL